MWPCMSWSHDLSNFTFLSCAGLCTNVYLTLEAPLSPTAALNAIQNDLQYRPVSPLHFPRSTLRTKESDSAINLVFGIQNVARNQLLPKTCILCFRTKNGHLVLLLWLATTIVKLLVRLQEGFTHPREQRRLTFFVPATIDNCPSL